MINDAGWWLVGDGSLKGKRKINRNVVSICIDADVSRCVVQCGVSSGSRFLWPSSCEWNEVSSGVGGAGGAGRNFWAKWLQE